MKSREHYRPFDYKNKQAWEKRGSSYLVQLFEVEKLVEQVKDVRERVCTEVGMDCRFEIRNSGISVMDVLKLISQGFTYERILFTHKSLTYEDIFRAAKIAGEIVEIYSAFKFCSLEKPTQQYHGLEKIRQRHPRAYEKWSDEEDSYVEHKYREGLSIQELAEILHRQPSAIRSRLRRLGLVE